MNCSQCSASSLFYRSTKASFMMFCGRHWAPDMTPLVHKNDHVLSKRARCRIVLVRARLARYAHVRARITARFQGGKQLVPELRLKAAPKKLGGPAPAPAIGTSMPVLALPRAQLPAFAPLTMVSYGELTDSRFDWKRAARSVHLTEYLK